MHGMRTRILAATLMVLTSGTQLGAQLGTRQAAQSLVGASNVALASAAASSHSAVSSSSRVMTQSEMSLTSGAGFWSSFWEGMKDAIAIVVILGVAWAVGEFCAQDQVTCA